MAVEAKTKVTKQKKQRWPFIGQRRYKSGLVGWTVDARLANGGERKTFATKGEAEGYADQCRSLKLNQGTKAFDHRELERFGKTVSDAVDFYLAHLRQQETSISVKAATEELIALRASGGRSARYCHDLRLRLGRFAIAFGEQKVAEIGTATLDKWLTDLNAAPGTKNTFRRDLRTLFSFCVKRGYASKNVASLTEVARQPETPPQILSVDEVRSLLTSSDAEVLPMIAIGAFAGLRSAELEKLDWHEVNLESGLIEVTAAKAKTGQRRLVKIEPVLRGWIEPHAKAHGPVLSLSGLRARTELMRRKAGFGKPGTETHEERKAGIKLKAWPQNALRHSFGSYWLAKFQDVAALALQMGNSPSMVFRHYRELVRPAQAESYWNLHTGA